MSFFYFPFHDREGAETGRKNPLIIPLQFNSWCHSSAAVQTDQLVCSSTRVQTKRAAKATCKMLRSGEINDALWPKRGSVEWVVFQYADWPAPTPVSMSGSTNMQQMASSLEKEKKTHRRNHQKSKTVGEKALVLDISQKCEDQSELCRTPGLNAAGAHLMLRLTNWKSPIHINCHCKRPTFLLLLLSSNYLWRFLKPTNWN